VDYQVAEFVRFITPDEALEDLIDERPSDHDCDLLLRLEQAYSVVYEIGGEARGTIFVPKEGER
jgi:hypothetical protein